MKVLKGQGSFVVLTPTEVLKDQLLMIERAGRTCYQSEKGEVTYETAVEFFKRIRDRRHESVIEHSSLCVKFLNCSRGFTHEMVRHRLASFSQESTRYVDYSKRGGEVDLRQFQIKCVVPPHRDENQAILLSDGRQMSFVQMLEEIEGYYRSLRLAGWVPEDARQVLPNALASEIVVTANFREWRHILKMRTDKAAHWEIREVMCKLLETLKEIVPVVFEDFVLAGEDKNGLRFYTLK